MFRPFRKTNSNSALTLRAKGSRLGAFLLSMSLFVSLGFPSVPAFAKEVEAKVVDNLSAELGFPIYSWAPESAPQAVLIAIHGATLHGRSYTKVAQELSKKGYVIFAPDMRGFGSWYHDHSKEEDETDFSHHVLYRQSEADLKALIKKAHELFPGKPVFLMGESVGANMAIRLLAGDPDCADGMILSSPAIKQRYFFGMSVVKQFMTVFFVNPGAQLDVTPYLRSRVSEDKRIVAERVNDPLGRNKMNVGELWKTRWFNKDSLKLLPNLPDKIAVLVLEGSEDKLFRADLIGDMMDQMPCTDKDLRLLKGKGHIHLETAYLPEDVQSVLETWLAEKTLKYSQKDTAKTLLNNKTSSIGTTE